MTIQKTCRPTTRCLPLLLLVLCAALLLSLPVLARVGKTASGSLSIQAEIDPKSKDTIRITVTPDETFYAKEKGETLYLFALRPYEDTEDVQTTLRSLSPIATTTVQKESVMKLTLDETGDRLYSGYAVAMGEGANYVLLSDPVYVTNVHVGAENRIPRPSCSSKKGIVSSESLLSETEYLGVSHAVIPIVLDEYVTAKRDNPAYYTSDSGTYTAFVPEKIDALDRHIAALRANGIHVYLRFVLNGTTLGTEAPTALLYAEGAEADASLYTVTADTKDAYRTARGIFSYFANRYAADTDAPPLDFILGYQVNEYLNWSDMGVNDLDAAVKAYAKGFRIAGTALSSVNGSSLVYIPVSNLFSSAEPFLYAFAEEMDGAPWGLGIAPYASSPLSDRLWEDMGAKDTLDTDYLTVKNLHLLSDFLKKEPFLYEGALRSVIVDDFGVQGTTGDNASQERQAASLAYAYYKISGLDFIDAFLYHRMIDGGEEHACYGLRTLEAEEKPAYRVFRYMDTRLGADVTAPYLAQTGEKKWSALIPGFSKKDAEQVLLYEETCVEDTEAYAKKYPVTALFTFTGGTLHGFMPTSGVATLSLTPPTTTVEGIGERVLSAETHAMAPYSHASVTADLTLSPAAGLDRVRALSATVYIDAPESDTASLRLQLGKAEGDEKGLFSAETTVAANTWVKVTFPILDYTRRVGTSHSLTLSAAIPAVTTEEDPGGSQAPFVLSVSDISVHPDKGTPLLTILLWILGLLCLAVLVFGILVIRANLRRQKRRRQLAAKRAQLARQRQMAAQKQAQLRGQQTDPRLRPPAATPTYHPADGRAPSAPRRTPKRSPDTYPGQGTRNQTNRRS